MELYISDHPLDCLTCSANGDCELQTQAGVVGLRDVRYGYKGANHLDAPTDSSNPYFTFESSKCIVCSRCVRACEEVQGTFALTILGRGFDSKVSPGGGDFFSSECVSCGACVQACPTATLNEKSVIAKGTPERSVVTTCAYCGVGCSFRAELKGEEVVRMVPAKSGKANEGHSCVKGRFAYGYATHKDRILKPMIRARIDGSLARSDLGRGGRLRGERVQAHPGASTGATRSAPSRSSRCTNEEVFLIQKLVRAGFGNNNIDTCARVCHSPTGYGLSKTFGTSAGTQDFKSVDKTDVVLVIGANPTDAHPVFASRMKKRLRAGAKLIVVDPRRIDLVRTPHVEADLSPARCGRGRTSPSSMRWRMSSSPRGWSTRPSSASAATPPISRSWARFIAEERHSPEATAAATGVAGGGAARRGAAVRHGRQRARSTTASASPSIRRGRSTVMAMANLAMATGNIGREGVGVNPLRGQNNVQGSCDMGSFPHEFSGYRHVSDDATREVFERLWGVALSKEPGLRIPNMMDEAVEGSFKGLYIQGEDIAQSDPDTQHITAGLEAMECVIMQDLFLNETARYAHVFFPGASFLEKDGTFTNAERRISRVRKAMAPLAGKADWEATIAFAEALGVPHELLASERNHGRDRRADADVRGRFLCPAR